MSMTPELPFVSVIIPTFNEQARIESCLNGLLAQDYPPDCFEIILIDNGSTDRTADIARNYTPNVFSLPSGSVAAARNRGATAARGEYFAFLDADCIPAPDWISSAVNVLKDKRAVTGAKCLTPSPPHWIEEIWFRQPAQTKTQVRYINSANMFLPKELFTELRGFNETIQTGEDSELCERARAVAQIISDPRIRVTHYGNPKTLFQFLKREIWHGLGALGSFRTNWFDKPFLATVTFLILTALQLSGALSWLSVGAYNLFLTASLFLILLFAAILWSRRGLIQSFADVAKLSLLYYLYFLGRSIALWLLIMKREYYHHNKQMD